MDAGATEGKGAGLSKRAFKKVPDSTYSNVTVILFENGRTSRKKFFLQVLRNFVMNKSLKAGFHANLFYIYERPMTRALLRKGHFGPLSLLSKSKRIQIAPLQRPC